MFLAILLVCNSHNECAAVMSPKMSETYEECVGQLDIGSENFIQEGLTVKDLVCLQFNGET